MSINNYTKENEIYQSKINYCNKILFNYDQSLISSFDVIHDLILEGFKLDEIDGKKIKKKYFEIVKQQPFFVSFEYIEKDIKEFDTIGVQTCIVCKEMLSESEFGITTRTTNGKQAFQSYCKKCSNEYGKKRWKEVNSKNSEYKNKSNKRRKILYEAQKQNDEFIQYRRLVSKNNYLLKRKNIEWVEKEKERMKQYRLRKKTLIKFQTLNPQP